MSKDIEYISLGKQLKYYFFDDQIGQSAIILPNGMKVIRILQRFIEDEDEKRGFLSLKTPLITKKDLLVKSDHYDFYKENIFLLDNDNESILKSVSCPFHIYTFHKYYKNHELPIKFTENTSLFRKSVSGSYRKMLKEKEFELTDGHIFCLDKHLNSLLTEELDFIIKLSNKLGIFDNLEFKYSCHKYGNNKYENKYFDWNKEEEKIKLILNNLNIDFMEYIDHAAFYGPKIDIFYSSSTMKSIILYTIQIDFSSAKRFEINKNGEPIIILHRSPMISYQAILSILIDSHKGRLPVWLAPIQVAVISLLKEEDEYITTVLKLCTERKIRFVSISKVVDLSMQIKHFCDEKVPIIVVIGDKEKAEKKLNVKILGNDKNKELEFKEFKELFD